LLFKVKDQLIEYTNDEQLTLSDIAHYIAQGRVVSLYYTWQPITLAPTDYKSLLSRPKSEILNFVEEISSPPIFSTSTIYDTQQSKLNSFTTLFTPAQGEIFSKSQKELKKIEENVVDEVSLPYDETSISHWLNGDRSLVT